MSNINTNGLNVTYPTPGVNNSSQGFRDNFASIKTNLDAAKSELSDLQAKVIVKSALTDTSLNNDMNNTLISNALVKGFRSTMYNLGPALSGTVNVNVSNGDVQYGTIVGDTTFEFTCWNPAGTQGKVQLLLTMDDPTAVITWPAEMDSTFALLENSSGVTLTAPADVTQLNFEITTNDCGVTLSIEPLNRNRKVAYINQGTPAVGNVAATGTITANTASTTVTGVGTLFTTEFVAGRILLSSANVVLGTVQSIANNTSLTFTANATANVSAVAFKRQLPIGAQGDTQGATSTDGTYLYICTQDYDGTAAIWKRITPTSY